MSGSPTTPLSTVADHHAAKEPSGPPALVPFRHVTAFAAHGVTSLELSVVSKVFADRRHEGMPAFTSTFCSDKQGALLTDLGLVMAVEHGLDAMRSADLIALLSSGAEPPTVSESVVDALHEAHRRGAIIAACGAGSFVLAETGLLDGRRVAVHRSLAERMATRFPKVIVDTQPLYADEGSVLTSAGSAVAMDMFLHLLRREYGMAVFTSVVQDAMVVPRRENGQVVYLPARPDLDGAHARGTEDTRLTELLQWVRTKLDETLSVNDLAQHALMSPRTFARRFREATGTTPYVWLRELRLDRAEELLETTRLPIEKIARLVGFGTDRVFRNHFIKRHGIGPRDYRRTLVRD